MTLEVGEVLALVTLNAIIDSILGLVIGLWLVATRAGRKALRGWTDWLDSPDADPYLEKMAEKVAVKMEPRLSEFEERLNQPVQIDLAPIVAMVTEAVVPKVKEDIEKVRAAIDGKIGFFKKVAKQTGEGVAEIVGEAAAGEAGVEGAEGELFAELDAALHDEEWAKEHKLAAFGLRLLKKELSSDEGRGSSSLARRGSYNPGLPKRRR